MAQRWRLQLRYPGFFRNNTTKLELANAILSFASHKEYLETQDGNAEELSHQAPKPGVPPPPPRKGSATGADASLEPSAVPEQEAGAVRVDDTAAGRGQVFEKPLFGTMQDFSDSILLLSRDNVVRQQGSLV